MSLSKFSANKKPSGAQYKKLREEKELNKQKLLTKVPKLTHFFSKCKGESENNEGGPSYLSVTDVVESDIGEVPVGPTSIEAPKTVSLNDEAVGELNGVVDGYDADSDYVVSSENQKVNNEEEEYFLPSFDSDPANWIVCDELRDYVAQNGASQNRQSVYTSSKRHYSTDKKDRYLTDKLFHRQLKNGELVNRSWMSYSQSKGCVFCIPCLLFSNHANANGNAFTIGFNDWKNASQRVLDHENSPYHKTQMRTLKLRGNKKGHVNSSLGEQMTKETEYWRNVLKRVVAAVKFLSMKGLAFRGSHEHLGLSDQGNFLGLIEFLSEFDPFLAEHLKLHGDGGSGNTSYISKATYEEFVLLMAQHVRGHIISEAKKAKYFGIVVDSTPDISHVDQLTLVLRYVNSDGGPVERFLCFSPNVGHKAEDIVDAILGVFDKFELDITKCRGQSYDNASNMAGIYSGVQARIKMLCPQAEFVPCAAHSLNLVGTVAVSSCVFAVSFFGLLQELYNFFTSSTYRWELYLNHKCSVVLKSLSKTRWAARHDACRALKENWQAIIETLKVIENDGNEKPSTRSDASALRVNLESLETAFLSIFWSIVLERFQKISSKLQYETTTLSKVKGYYQSLVGFVTELRNDFCRLETLAREKSGLNEYKSEHQRKRKRASAHGEFGTSDSESEVVLTGSDHFRVNTFYVMVDSLRTELEARAEKYENLQTSFGFLEELKQLSSSTITTKAKELWTTYPSDLEESVIEECLHMKAFLMEQKSFENRDVNLLDLSKLLVKEDVADIYPNVEIALRMALSTPATNCTGERSFSALRRIKNYLRSTMGTERLSSTAILAIESAITKNVDYDELINKFAAAKSRKKALL